MRTRGGIIIPDAEPDPIHILMCVVCNQFPSVPGSDRCTECEAPA